MLFAQAEPVARIDENIADANGHVLEGEEHLQQALNSDPRRFIATLLETTSANIMHPLNDLWWTIRDGVNDLRWKITDPFADGKR